MRVWGAALMLLIPVGFGMAQDAGTSKNEADYHSAAWISEQSAKLAEQAKTGSGTATLPLEKYPGHFMNLTVRTKSGGGELHGQWSDVFVALDGEANVITGGTLVDRKDVAGGESRGSGVAGGTDHIMHKGDVIHISPGVAHQTVVPAGKTFTYFVVKVEAK